MNLVRIVKFPGNKRKKTVWGISRLIGGIWKTTTKGQFDLIKQIYNEQKKQ